MSILSDTPYIVSTIPLNVVSNFISKLSDPSAVDPLLVLIFTVAFGGSSYIS